MLEILTLILSDISKIFYGENYVLGNNQSRTRCTRLNDMFVREPLVEFTFRRSEEQTLQPGLACDNSKIQAPA